MKNTPAKEKKKMSVGKRILLTVGIVLAAILFVLLAVRLYFRLPVWSYYRASEKGFEIPGLSDGFVPQGLDYDDRTDLFWVTGYMDDGSASPIYLVKRSTGELYKTVYLANEDGSIYNGHTGGVAVSWDFVYIAGGGRSCIYAYSCDEIMTAEDGITVKALGSISTKSENGDSLRVSSVFVDDEYHRLYAAEYYSEPKNPTPENHKLTTPAGDRHGALAIAFELDFQNGVLGVDPTPKLAISLPDLVQGFCIGGDSIFLSTSKGASFSHVYEYPLANQASEAITFLGIEMPLYYLDSGNLAADYRLPPMSEELVVVDGKLYTMCESACNKYFFGKLTSSKWCYATELWKMNQ